MKRVINTFLIMSTILGILTGCVSETENPQQISTSVQVVSTISVSEQSGLNNDLEKQTQEITVPMEEIALINAFPKMSFDQKKQLNIFFSNFSEIDFGEFDADNYNTEDLILFGILHNIVNYGKRINYVGDYETLSSKYVTQAIKKYFGIEVNPISIDGFEYNDGNFVWPAADGVQYLNFSQVENFIDNGDGTYTAKIKIFNRGFDLDGNNIVYEPMESWKDINPELISSMQALVKKANVDGKDTYYLLKYWSVPDEVNTVVDQDKSEDTYSTSDNDDYTNNIINYIVTEGKKLLSDSDPIVQAIKGGTLGDYQDVTVGEAFDKFFVNPAWYSFDATTGEKVVEFSGNCFYQNVEVEAKLQFILSDDNTSFEIGALSFNDVPQMELMKWQLIEKIYENIKQNE